MHSTSKESHNFEAILESTLHGKVSGKKEHAPGVASDYSVANRANQSHISNQKSKKKNQVSVEAMMQDHHRTHNGPPQSKQRSS